MGIALRQSDTAFSVVDVYYTAAKREPTTGGNISVGSTDSFKATFLEFVRLLNAKQQSQVVIVAHGNDDGLIMATSPNGSTSASTSVINDLIALVDDLPNWDSTKVSAFTNNTSCTEAELKELTDLCAKIRGHAASSLELHFRGCKIGKKIDNLKALRKLFGSTLVSAPTCPMLYAPFSPKWSKPGDQDVDAWASANTPDTRRREFAAGAGGSRLLLDVNYGGSSSSTQGVIQHANDFPAWATQVYGNSNHGKTISGPIAAMWPDDTYFLPHESGYVSQIATAK